jgi:cysteine synthase A
MLPDTGERYLSTPLFADVPADMSQEELEISRSTPGHRFDVAPPGVTTVRRHVDPVAPEPEVVRFIDDTIHDAARPVVMFALRWCEFCWSLRRLFERCGIDYVSIDLDATDMQAQDRGGAIRAALATRTGVTTIPQVFVGGEFVGGCTEVFDRWRDGSLQAALGRLGVRYDGECRVDPYSLLPAWLVPRKRA